MADQLIDRIGEHHPDLVYPTGFEDCVIGVARRFGDDGPLIALDYNKVIDKLMTRDQMTREEAVEFFDFNIIGAYVGEHTPCFVETEF